MMHVYGDPLKYRDLKDRIAVEKFNSAIILCDAAWVDPDQVHNWKPLFRVLSQLVAVASAWTISDMTLIIVKQGLGCFKDYTEGR